MKVIRDANHSHRRESESAAFVGPISKWPIDRGREGEKSFKYRCPDRTDSPSSVVASIVGSLNSARAPIVAVALTLCGYFRAERVESPLPDICIRNDGCSNCVVIDRR